MTISGIFAGSLNKLSSFSFVKHRARTYHRKLNVAYPRFLKLEHVASSTSNLQNVVDDAVPVPDGVSPEDFQKFLALLNSRDIAEVEAKTLELVKNGELTEEVLKAAFATLEQAQQRKDEQIIPSLTVRTRLASPLSSLLSSSCHRHYPSPTQYIHPI
jgi:hypothetical protein